MDQALVWWVRVVFDRWAERPGPRYQQVAAAVLEAVQAGVVPSGTRLPAERLLADALGMSRGTIVAALDQLVAAGIARRRQGAGTFVAGRPGWLRGPASTPAAALLLRRLAAGASLDLSLSVPPGVEHLPAVEAPSLAGADHGLDPRGAEVLRAAIARHLTRHQRLPTTADQIVVTAGAQQALGLLLRVAGRRVAVVAGCPTYPGLRSAAARTARLIAVPNDSAAGIDPESTGRAARRVESPIVYVAPTGANPTGSVMPRARRRSRGRLRGGRLARRRRSRVGGFVLRGSAASAAWCPQ